VNDFSRPKPAMKLFLSIDEFNDAQLERIERLTNGATLVERKNYQDDAPVESEFNHCDVVFGNVPAHWIEQSEALRWAQLDSVGFGEYRALDWSRLEKQITMTNLAGFFADPVAQTALAGILSLYRGIDTLALARPAKQWHGDPMRSTLRTLTNANVVLFGQGAINLRFAELLEPFNCVVKNFGKQWQPNELNAALSNADIVVCTVPETDSTVGVFNLQRLFLLKPDAIFVNCGRGSAVDESALASLLNKKKIGGAVLDVTIDEPLDDSHPFWDCPNLLLTQHTGGGSSDELDRKISVFANNLKRYKNSEPLKSIVDFKRGY